jgi:hypothetical protein
VVTGATEATATYKELEVTWSGSGGIDGKAGDEDLKIEGSLPNAMTVKLYAIEDCEVTVSYFWSVVPTYKPFTQRLADLVAKYPNNVIVATKQGKPAIFVDTASMSDSKIEPFFADLYKTIGTNTLMAWNPAGENFFHLRTPTSTLLEERFRNKAMTVYGSPSYWDPSSGNLDDEYAGDDEEACYEGCGEDCWQDTAGECGEDYYDCMAYEACQEQCVDECIDQGNHGAERAVALILLTNAQMTLLNDYLVAITDDPDTNLGPSEYNGGVPPYFTGDPDGKHNCTSWFSEWLHRKVSYEWPVYYNPAALMKAYTTGGYSGQLASQFRALLVFNYHTPPASGATVPENIALDFGH